MIVRVSLWVFGSLISRQVLTAGFAGVLRQVQMDFLPGKNTEGDLNHWGSWQTRYLKSKSILLSFNITTKIRIQFEIENWNYFLIEKICFFCKVYKMFYITIKGKIQKTKNKNNENFLSELLK